MEHKTTLLGGALSLPLFFVSLCTIAQSAGSLDASFGNGGKVVTSITNGSDEAHAVGLQTDGKIVVAGYSTSQVTGKDFSLARYQENGSLDSTFGVNGIVTTDLQLGSDDVANCLAIQVDGKIVVGGYSDNGSNRDAAIVRYKTDGTIDSGFGSNGIVLTNYEAANQDEIKCLKLHQITGNIIVGGTTVINSSTSKPVVARYKSDGALDTTFNHTGIRLMWITNLDYQYLFTVEDIHVLANGKIVGAGWRDFPGLSWDADFWVGRISSDGSMDNTFSTDGVNIYNGSFNGHDRAFSVYVKPDNNIMISGGSYVNTLGYQMILLEINSSGTVGNQESTFTFNSSLNETAYGMALDVNGNYILTGTSGIGSARSVAVARIKPNMALDNTFDTDGKVTTTFNGNALNGAFDVLVQSDNKIVVVGYAGDDFAIARYLGDGIPQLDLFELQTPTNHQTNVNGTSVAFNWTDAYGATNYEMQLDTLVDFTSPITQTYTIANSNKTVTGLLPTTTYYWRVRATDGTNWGSWTAVWDFNTLTPVNPGFGEELFSDKVNIYPNPASGALTVSTPLIKGNLTITDISGRIVYTTSLEYVDKQTISLDGLAEGSYMVTINSDKGNASKPLTIIR